MDGATLGALCLSLEQHLPALTPRQLATACTSLSALCAQPAAGLQGPPASMLTALRLRCEGLLPSMRVRDACNAALGLVRLAACAPADPTTTADVAPPQAVLGEQPGTTTATTTALLPGAAAAAAAAPPPLVVVRPVLRRPGGAGQAGGGLAGRVVPAVAQLVRARLAACTFQDLAQALEACATVSMGSAWSRRARAT